MRYADNDAVKYLAVLELKPGATFREVKRAWRDLSIVWHPDRQPERLKPKATEKLTCINLAYEWLSKNPHILAGLSGSSAKSAEGTVVRCAKCNTRNRIYPNLKSGVHFRKFTCKACNEFLFALVCCSECGRNHPANAIRAYQGAEPGRYQCRDCEKPLFGLIVCDRCNTKNCIAPSDGKTKPVCAKCKRLLLPRHRKSLESRHIIYAIGGAIIGAILGALGS